MTHRAREPSRCVGGASRSCRLFFFETRRMDPVRIRGTEPCLRTEPLCPRVRRPSIWVSSTSGRFSCPPLLGRITAYLPWPLTDLRERPHVVIDVPPGSTTRLRDFAVTNRRHHRTTTTTTTVLLLLSTMTTLSSSSCRICRYPT